MQLFSPIPTAEEVAGATARTFTSAPVEAGAYTMQIKTAPKVITSKKGNKYLQLMLTHTGDDHKGATAVYPSFNLNEIGQSQLVQLGLSLGLSTEDAASIQWGAMSDAVDEKGRQEGVIAVKGDALDITGRTLSVYLTKKEAKNIDGSVKLDAAGATQFKNEVARFIVG